MTYIVLFTDGTNECYERDGVMTCTGPGFDDPVFDVVVITGDMSAADIQALLESAAGESIICVAQSGCSVSYCTCGYIEFRHQSYFMKNVLE